MADAEGNRFWPYDIEVAGSESEALTEDAWFETFGDISGVKSGGALTFAGLTATLAPVNLRAHGSPLIRLDPWSDASPPTSTSAPRRDMLVARRQRTSGEGAGAVPGKTFLTVLRGTPAATPAEPTTYDPANDEPLFSWQVPGNGGTVVTGVRDLRRWLNPRPGSLPRVITRNHTPIAPGIPSGNFRESGVADGPSIAPFTLYTAGTPLVVATFRLGVAAVNTGYVTFQLKIDGVAVADGVARTTDESRMIHAAVALTAGSHTIALRAQAVGGDATWDSARVTIYEGAAE